MMKIIKKINLAVAVIVGLLLLIPTFAAAYVRSPGGGDSPELISAAVVDAGGNVVSTLTDEDVTVKSLRDDSYNEALRNAYKEIAANADDLGALGTGVNTALDEIAARKSSELTSADFVAEDLFYVDIDEDVELSSGQKVAITINNGVTYGEKPVLLQYLYDEDSGTGTWSVIDPDDVTLNSDGTLTIALEESCSIAVLEYAEPEVKEYTGAIEAVKVNGEYVVSPEGYVAVGIAVNANGSAVKDSNGNIVYIYANEVESYAQGNTSGASSSEKTKIAGATTDAASAIDTNKSPRQLDSDQLALRALLDTETAKVNSIYDHGVLNTGKVFDVILSDAAESKLSGSTYIKVTVDANKNYTEKPIVAVQGEDGTWSLVDSSLVTLNSDGTVSVNMTESGIIALFDIDGDKAAEYIRRAEEEATSTSPVQTTESTTAPEETTTESTTAPEETTPDVTTAPEETTENTTVPEETTENTTSPEQTTENTTAPEQTTTESTTAPEETTTESTTAPEQTTERPTEPVDAPEVIAVTDDSGKEVVAEDGNPAIGVAVDENGGTKYISENDVAVSDSDNKENVKEIDKKELDSIAKTIDLKFDSSIFNSTKAVDVEISDELEKSGSTVSLTFDSDYVRAPIVMQKNEETGEWSAIDASKVHLNEDGTVTVDFDKSGTVVFLSVDEQTAEDMAVKLVQTENNVGKEVVAEVVDTNDQNIYDVGVWEIIVTPYSSKDWASSDVKENLEVAFEEIVNEDYVENLKAEVEEFLKSKNVEFDFKNKTVIDLFDITINNVVKEYLDVDGHYIKLTFDVKFTTVPVVLHRRTDTNEWEVISGENVTLNEDGTVSVVFDSLSPIAFLTAPADGPTSSSRTWIFWLCGILLLLIILFIIIILVFKRRDDDDEDEKKDNIDGGDATASNVS